MITSFSILNHPLSGFGDQTIPVNTVIYQYDVLGILKKQNDGLGRVDLYSYDNQGRELSHTRQKADGTQSITTSASYDKNGNKRFETDGNGTTVENRYKAGRLKEVITDGLTTTYNYYADGSRQSVVYPNGAREDYTYFSNGLLQALTNKNINGSIIDSYSYTYDRAGNQTSKTDAKGTTNYTYDSLNRLQAVTEPGGKVTSYTFDKAGNRLTESVTIAGSTVNHHLFLQQTEQAHHHRNSSQPNHG